jgi:hypothetical protein
LLSETAADTCAQHRDAIQIAIATRMTGLISF